MKKYALILALTTILLGCATSPVSDMDSKNTTLSPNKNKSYRISSGQDGTIQIQPSSF